MTYNLSKSRYCSGVQCPKMLWLKKNMPEEFDNSVINEAVMATGNEVGDLAMGLFGEYVEVPFGDLKQMIQKTKELIEANTPIIAEASFSVDGLLVADNAAVKTTKFKIPAAAVMPIPVNTWTNGLDVVFLSNPEYIVHIFP